MFDFVLIIKLFLVFKLSICSLLYIGKLVKKVNIVLEYGSFCFKKYVNFFIVFYYFMCLILYIFYLKKIN